MRRYYPLILAATINIGSNAPTCSVESKEERNKLLEAIYAEQNTCTDADHDPHRVTLAEQDCLFQLLPTLPPHYNPKNPLLRITNEQLETILTTVRMRKQ